MTKNCEPELLYGVTAVNTSPDCVMVADVAAKAVVNEDALMTVNDPGAASASGLVNLMTKLPPDNFVLIIVGAESDTTLTLE